MTKNRFLPLLMVLFAGSGCAALIYEILWFQLLQLVIGSSAVSLCVLLSTFMGGMCAGSVLLPRTVSVRQHPLRVYAVIELGMALFGILVLFGIPYAGGLYAAIGGHGLWGILLQGLICGICLLPPTFLMGATLPAIARWVEATPEGISWLGFFYGGNILGAIIGSLVAGFYLLRVYDMVAATYVAAAINLTVALIAYRISVVALYEPRQSGNAGHSPAAINRHSRPGTVYLVIALSGLCALGAEVVWTRLLSLIMGATVYTFSIILAVFLLGLGIGSSIGSLRSRASARPQRDLGLCQMLLTAAIAWAAYMITSSLPYWPIDPALSLAPWFNFQMDLFRAALAILPAACLWGASFPLALAAVASDEQDLGKLVSGVYAANTAGAILGAVGFTLVFIKWFGTQHSQQILVGLSAVAALLLLAPIGRITSGIAALLGVLFVLSVAQTPSSLVAYGRFLVRNLALRNTETKAELVPNILYMGEGMNASVAVSATPGGVRTFHVSGKIEASTEPHDMRLQRMLGHMSALSHRQPRSVLIVGLGSGITAGTFALYPGVERIVICEIEPLIPQVVSKYFRVENYNVLADPRVEVIYDDARHYILTTREKFDIITSDPIHPWVKGAATLYTREYFELARQHLNPGGVISQWVPLYESSLEVVKSEIATFLKVFPNGTIWSNDISGVGYDVVLLGKNGAPAVDLDEVHRRLNRTDHLPVVQSLKDVGFGSVIELFATYAGRGSDLVLWLDGAEINRDRNLRLQYLSGMGLNVFQNGIIYNDLLSHRKFPDDLILSSPEVKQALRDAFVRPQSAR